MLNKPRTLLCKHYYRNKGKHQKYICNFIFKCDKFASMQTLNIFLKSENLRVSQRQNKRQFERKYKQFGRNGRP